MKGRLHYIEHDLAEGMFDLWVIQGLWDIEWLLEKYAAFEAYLEGHA